MKNEEMYYNIKEEKENNKKYNERLFKEFNIKIEKLEKEINQIKKNTFNSSEIKFKYDNDFIEKDDDVNDSFKLLLNDTYEKKKEFLLDQSKEFENSIVLYEKEVINPNIKALIEILIQNSLIT